MAQLISSTNNSSGYPNSFFCHVCTRNKNGGGVELFNKIVCDDCIQEINAVRFPTIIASQIDPVQSSTDAFEPGVDAVTVADATNTEANS